VPDTPRARHEPLFRPGHGLQGPAQGRGPNARRRRFYDNRWTAVGIIDISPPRFPSFSPKIDYTSAASAVGVGRFAGLPQSPQASGLHHGTEAAKRHEDAVSAMPGVV